VLPSSLVKDADPAKRTGPTIMDPLAYALHMKHMLAIVELAKLFSCFCECSFAKTGEEHFMLSPH